MENKEIAVSKDEKQLAQVVLCEDGPQAIGMVANREVVELSQYKILVDLRDAANEIREGLGADVFNNEIRRMLKKDMVEMTWKEDGSHIFIANNIATIAFRKDANELTVEIRRAGLPYNRGILSKDAVDGVFQLKQLEA